MLTFVLLIACAAFAQGVTITSDENQNKKYFNIGDDVILTCKGTAPLKWKKLDPKTKQLLDVGASDLGVTGSDALPEAQLKLKLKVEDAGTYSCEDAKGEKQTRNINVIPNTFKEALNESNVIAAGTPDRVILQCLQPYFADKAPLQWQYKGSDGKVIQIQNSDNKNYTIGDESNGYALTIRNKAGDRFIWGNKYGSYSCSFNSTDPAFDTLNGKFATVDYQATPDVSIEGAANKSATKDEGFSVTCVITGDNRKQPIVWRIYKNESGDKFDEVAEPVDDPADKNSKNWKLEEDGKKARYAVNSTITLIRDLDRESVTCAGNYSGTPLACSRSSTLAFSVVVDEDKGRYKCVAKNDFGENSAVTTIKVKDKLAALWPFLGIVAEVIILCAIIFIYERRRSKSIEEEDEAEPMKNADNRDASDNVRNRKA